MFAIRTFSGYVFPKSIYSRNHLLVLLVLLFNIKDCVGEICPKYYNGDISKHLEGEVICPKYYSADTTRIFNGKIVKTPQGHYNFTFKPKINVGEIVRAAHLKLSWEPKYPKKDSQISFQMIASEIKKDGKFKGYPLDRQKVKYREAGNHFFDVTSSNFSSKMSYSVEIRIPKHLVQKSNENKKISVTKLIPIGSIANVSLVLHTSDITGKLKRTKIEDEAWALRLERSKREARRSEGNRKKCNKRCQERRKKAKQKAKQKAEQPEPPCQLTPYWVNFTDIGWSNWIQSPEGFEMGFCQGSCAHNPIPFQYEPTNHAIFQQLYHSRGLGVHPPCCIPIEYENLSMLTIIKHKVTREQPQPDLMKMHLMQKSPKPPIQTEEEFVTLKSYDNMKIKRCGCR